MITEQLLLVDPSPSARVVSLEHGGAPRFAIVSFGSDADGGLYALGGNGTIHRLVSSDRATCDGVPATIVGTAGDDSLEGTAGDDVIIGLGGDDVIRALEGRDTVCAGPGHDTESGGRGRDVIFGESGNDTLLWWAPE